MINDDTISRPTADATRHPATPVFFAFSVGATDDEFAARGTSDEPNEQRPSRDHEIAQR